jgi:hypothetical protein
VAAGIHFAQLDLQGYDESGGSTNTLRMEVLMKNVQQSQLIDEDSILAHFLKDMHEKPLEEQMQMANPVYINMNGSGTVVFTSYFRERGAEDDEVFEGDEEEEFEGGQEQDGP